MHALPEMPRVVGAFRYRAKGAVREGPLRWLARLRFQLGGGLVVAVLLPALIRGQWGLRLAPGSLENTVVATAIALIAGTYILRRVNSYPGVQASSFVLSIFLATYGAVAFGFLVLRIDYSRFQLLASFLLVIPWFTFASIVERHYRRPLLALLPVGDAMVTTELSQCDWRVLQNPAEIPVDTSGIVADLRADLPPSWEKLLAASALKGIPVYHYKHVVESLTGRVQIEHLSENSLGSLLPSSIYLRLKRLVDALGAVLALPFIVPIGIVTALAIKLEDGGPVFYTQPRIGLGGNVFTIYKFRTMRQGADSDGHFTEGDDPRVTRIGRGLRRWRIDELPQVLNVLKGEMSWIGPRPEALPLAEWYEEQIPFYSYRHIVRPGISGWAQVQQGYAAQIDAVTGKLHYDFFYIKHFSPWLDLLITARTIRTIVTGFGSR